MWVKEAFKIQTVVLFLWCSLGTRYMSKSPKSEAFWDSDEPLLRREAPFCVALVLLESKMDFPLPLFLRSIRCRDMVNEPILSKPSKPSVRVVRGCSSRYRPRGWLASARARGREAAMKAFAKIQPKGSSALSRRFAAHGSM